MTLPLQKHQAKGVYGKYFKLSKTKGIKILISTGFKTRETALESWAFRKAKKEMKLLKKASKSKIVPKCYGVKIVWNEKRSLFEVGIIMQHLGETTLANHIKKYKKYKEKETSILDKLQETIKKYKIKHNDLHANNVMIFKNKFFVIDFSPDQVKEI
jgi:tRNA A-37 threonylcarbamoyl transferase component Bud32